MVEVLLTLPSYSLLRRIWKPLDRDLAHGKNAAPPTVLLLTERTSRTQDKET